MDGVPPMAFFVVRVCGVTARIAQSIVLAFSCPATGRRVTYIYTRRRQKFQGFGKL